MKNNPIPKNESARIKKLYDLNILDTDAEQQFDDLTKLAAEICDVPICLISLIDVDRQWFKSKVGLDADETHRDISFCQYAIMEEHIFEVENALKDERFKDNPLVIEAPSIRFYAGKPLTDDEGFNLGTLCVIDEKPKKLNNFQKQALETIGQTVIRLLLMRKVTEERRNYARLFELSPDMLCIAGVDGFFKQINPAFTQILGWSEEELKSKPFVGFVHPDDIDSTIKETEKLSQGAITIGFENRYQTKNGGYVRMNWMARPDKETGELFAVARDVTELYNTRQSLIVAKELAEKSSRAKDVFLSNVSHEIRTPLNAIIGFSDLLKKTPLNSQQETYLDTVTIASKNLFVLINDVLDVSKIDSGKLELEEKPFSVVEIINDTIKMQSHLARTKGIKLFSAIDHEVPQRVIGDPTRLTQVLVNLLSNAIKFTNEGHVEVTLYADNRGNETDITIKVKDSGIGIHPDKLDIIFDRFSQAESSTTREYGGTGLGLNIVKMLVELHGGKVRAESEKGRGSEFIFNITYPIASAETPNVRNVDLNDHGIPELDDIRILLVEDNEMNQTLATIYLKRNKANVELAENGLEAVEMMQANPNGYDLILMDLQMPKMDGFQTATFIRKEINQDIPIIACSAHSLVGEKSKCLEVGMNDYLAKPYSEKSLIEIINQYLQLPESPINIPSTSPEENNEVPLKDDFTAILNQLEAEEGSEFTETMVDLLKGRLPEFKKTIELALKDKDWDVVRKTGHTAAGSLSAIQFMEGYQLAKDLEAIIKSNQEADINDKANEFFAYINRALAAV